MTSSHLDTVPFHRLGRTAAPRWWRPIATLAVSFGLYMFLFVAVILPFGLLPFVDVETDLDRMDQPVPLAFSLLLLTLMIPAALLAVRLVGRRPAGTLASVTGRFRWRIASRATILSAALLLLSILVQGGWWDPVEPLPQAALMTGLVLLLVPFQAAGEEIIFRGLLPQLLGSWFRSPLIAYGLPSVLFMYGHIYSLPGLLATGVFALAAGWLTWRSGGIELAVGLHVANNLIAFLAGVWGWADLNATEVSWFEATVQIVVVVVVAGILWVTCRHLCRPDQPAVTGAAAEPAKSPADSHA